MFFDENTVLKNIRDYIYKESGIFFEDSKLYQLKNKIEYRLKEIKTIKNLEHYLRFLKYNDEQNKELFNLFDIITTGETEFFRDKAQLNVFQNKILPLILKKNEDSKTINIWSAGCSTGEEPYTIIILIMEKLLSNISKWNIKCFASDISASSLHTARQGIYSSHSLRDTSEELIKKYFYKKDKHFIIKEHIKNYVQFNLLNLNNPFRMKLLPQMDIIFCRNVLIYFNLESKKKVLNNLYEKLKNDGYLFLGHSESLYGIEQKFKPISFDNLIVYKKE